MGKVLRLETKEINKTTQELISLLHRARSGEVTGLIYVVSVGKESESGITGEFADDLAWATIASSKCFSSLISHRIAAVKRRFEESKR